jgi:co-chaperonin GroES (HSP10)|nr:MAG TPA: mHsp60, mHsp10, Mitochondrial, Chaperonin, Complex, Symmetric [Crassvirales sp.]
MIKVKKIKPMFTALITTMDLYETDSLTSGGIIDSTKQKGTVKEYQKVVAVGDSVRGIKAGDLVCIDATRFAVKKHKDNSIKTDIEGGNPILEYRFDIVEMDGKSYMLLQDRDIQFIIEEYDEIEEPKKSNLVTAPPDIII